MVVCFFELVTDIPLGVWDLQAGICNLENGICKLEFGTWILKLVIRVIRWTVSTLVCQRLGLGVGLTDVVTLRVSSRDLPI